MKDFVKIIKSLDDDLCRIILIASLDGRHPDAIYNILRNLDPTLTREEFDKRMIDCRQKLWAAIGKERQ